MFLERVIKFCNRLTDWSLHYCASAFILLWNSTSRSYFNGEISLYNRALLSLIEECLCVKGRTTHSDWYLGVASNSNGISIFVWSHSVYMNCYVIILAIIDYNNRSYSFHYWVFDDVPLLLIMYMLMIWMSKV